MTLSLEAEKAMSLDEVKQALASISNNEISENGRTLDASFPDSNVSFTVKTELDDTSVLTEDLSDVGWEVGLRIYFNVDPTLPNALDDIKKFIIELSRLSSANFALSFGYETLYALKDENGLVLTEVF